MRLIHFLLSFIQTTKSFIEIVFELVKPILTGCTTISFLGRDLGHYPQFSRVYLNRPSLWAL